MKKADISMNTIVMAAIALIVMVVLILVFTGKVHWFTANIDSCEKSNQGVCKSQDQCEGPQLGKRDCSGSEICCGQLKAG